MEIKRIAVYCGSAKGNDPVYVEQAKAIIHEMHKNGMGLVYGGGNVGIMGIIADEMLQLGGEVIGIIPQKLLEKEVAHHDIKNSLWYRICISAKLKCLS